jgi:dTDP-4-amino-4,6-dideoxygalactose transaminase
VSADVPFFSFASAPPELRSEWRRAIDRVVESGVFVGGPEVESFEDEYARYCGVDHCIGVANGLDAITLSLRAIGLGPGDRIAIPGHTFIATWLAVLAVGAEPVGIDIDSRGLMDLTHLETISPIPDAVVPVHIHGQLVDMPRLMAWAGPRGIPVVEDCAQAHGARAEGWGPGRLSDAAAYSFYPSKNLGGLGDGGGIVTRRSDVADRARTLRNYGAEGSDKYLHLSIGVNSRLDPMQAAVLRVNLGNLDDWNATRKDHAHRYLDALGTAPGNLNPLVPNPSDSVWHHFVVVPESRADLHGYLLKKGIHAEVHYPRSAADEVAAITGVVPEPLLASRRLAARTLSIPLHQWMSAGEVQRVADSLRGYRA